jgi:hypothetical protein
MRCVSSGRHACAQLYGRPLLWRVQCGSREQGRCSGRALKARSIFGQCGSASMVVVSHASVGAGRMDTFASGRKCCSRAATPHEAADVQPFRWYVRASMTSACSGSTRCLRRLEPWSGKLVRSKESEKQTAVLDRIVAMLWTPSSHRAWCEEMHGGKPVQPSHHHPGPLPGWGGAASHGVGSENALISISIICTVRRYALLARLLNPRRPASAGRAVGGRRSQVAVCVAH